MRPFTPAKRDAASSITGALAVLPRFETMQSGCWKRGMPNASSRKWRNQKIRRWFSCSRTGRAICEHGRGFVSRRTGVQGGDRQVRGNSAAASGRGLAGDFISRTRSRRKRPGRSCSRRASRNRLCLSSNTHRPNCGCQRGVKPAAMITPQRGRIRGRLSWRVVVCAAGRVVAGGGPGAAGAGATGRRHAGRAAAGTGNSAAAVKPAFARRREFTLHFGGLRPGRCHHWNWKNCWRKNASRPAGCKLPMRFTPP